jgi:rfaE bifunctional protein nucleotidyltransferase chain/domain
MNKVFVNGTFDVLHPGHVALLRHAASQGDYLLVAIDSDRRVSELKGAGRPFFDAVDRKYMLLAIAGVDEVAVFDSDQDLEAILTEYQPDVMVKGSDYRGKAIVGQHLVPHIDFFERINEYSSTKTIQHLAVR